MEKGLPSSYFLSLSRIVFSEIMRITRLADYDKPRCKILDLEALRKMGPFTIYRKTLGEHKFSGTRWSPTFSYEGNMTYMFLWLPIVFLKAMQRTNSPDLKQ